MAANGMSAFQPALRFVEEFCDNYGDVDHYRSFIIARKKGHIYPSPEYSQQFNDMREAAERRKAESKNFWDGELTNYDRKLQRMRASNAFALAQEKRPFREKMARLWEEECLRDGDYIEIAEQDDTLASRVRVWQSVFERWACENEISFKKKGGTKGSGFLIEGFHGNYHLALDNKLLAAPYRPPIKVMNTGEMLDAGPLFAMSIDIVGDHSIIKEDTLRISLESFFPFKEIPLGNNCYSMFHSPKDLVTVSLANLKMFGILRHELDSCLAGSVSD